MIMFDFFVKTRKWLCIDLYKSLSQKKNVNKQTRQYENVMLFGHFNNKNLGVFMNTFNLDS